MKYSKTIVILEFPWACDEAAFVIFEGTGSCYPFSVGDRISMRDSYKDIVLGAYGEEIKNKRPHPIIIEDISTTHVFQEGELIQEVTLSCDYNENEHF